MLTLPVHKNLWSPADTTRKYTRPGVELLRVRGWLMFTPVIASNPKYGFPLLGPACASSGLMKDSSINNIVFCVRETSDWARHHAQIGELRPVDDMRFSDRLIRFLLDSSCHILDEDANEFPSDCPDSGATGSMPFCVETGVMARPRRTGEAADA
jgi:hypothetical protein